LLTAALASALCGGAATLTVAQLGVGSAAVAQDASGPPPSQGRQRFGQILMSLNLSDQEKSQIKAIMQNTRQQNQNADRDTRRANMQAAFKKIDAILTPDQRQQLHAKLDALRKERNPSSQQR
jgi:Spy/CpxP family protein refolding chaperone